MEDLGSDDEEETEEEAEGLVKTPRKRRSPPVETPESTPPAPQKKRVKFPEGVGGVDYVEVTHFSPADAQGVSIDDIPPAGAQEGTADDSPPAGAQGGDADDIPPAGAHGGSEDKTPEKEFEA